jgi:HEAT repeat protein/photosystem II stability/assembly factor-like uncharacterized protein
MTNDSVLQVGTLQKAPSDSGYFGNLYERDGRIWAIGGAYYSAVLAVSCDGAHFYQRPIPDTSGLRDLAWADDGGLFIVGEYGLLAHSADQAASWTTSDLGTGGCLYTIVIDGAGAIWIGGDDGLLLCSTDDETFSPVELDNSSRVGRLSIIDDTVWAGCGDGRVYVMTGSGPRQVTDLGHTITAIAKTSTGTILISGDGGLLARSIDGVGFDLVDLGTLADVEDVAETEAGILAVGSDGLIVISTDDGQSFTRVAHDDTSHLWSILPSGSGALIGGDEGLVLWLRSQTDTTWVDVPDVIAAEPGPRDAEFEVDPDTYLTHLADLAAQLVPARSSMAEAYEDLWGLPIPTQLDDFVRLTEAGMLDLYEWSTETELFGIPTDRNTFEYAVKRNQKNYLGTYLPELFGGLVFTGSLRNGDSYHLSVDSDDDLKSHDPALPRQLYCFDHEDHDLDAPLAPNLSRYVYFSSLCQAITDHQVSPAAARRFLTALDGTIAPTWHYRSTIEATLDGDQLNRYTTETQNARVKAYRSRWLIYLLRNDGVVSVSDIPRVFHERVNYPLTEERHEAWLEGSSIWPTTLLYCLWRTFFFGNDAYLADYLALARESKSRLVRDAGALIEEFQAGRKKLGSIKNIHKLRRRFQALDLDPSRAAEREAEAAAAAEALDQARQEQQRLVAEAISAGADLAELAWADLANLPLHEAIEEALRADEALTPMFAVIDFVLGQGWNREGLSLSHEKDHALETLEELADPRILPLLLGCFVRDAKRDAEPRDAVCITSSSWHEIRPILQTMASLHPDERLVSPLRAELAVKPEKYEHRRELAAELLGLLNDTHSAPVLANLAEKSDSNEFPDSFAYRGLNSAIAIALGRLKDPATVPTLLRIATDPVESYDYAASHAAMALAEFGTVEHWQALLAAASGKQSTPASYIVWAVGKLGLQADEPTRAEIAGALRTFEPTHDSPVLELARFGMAAVLERDPGEAAERIHCGLTEYGWSDSTTNRMRVFACELATIENLDHPELLTLARRDNRGVREAAQAALTALGHPAPQLRKLNLPSLLTIAANDGAAALLPLLTDPDVIFKGSVPLALAECDDPAVRPGLRDFGLSLITSTLEDGRVDEDEVGYPLRWTLRALLALGESDELIELAAAALNHPSRDIRDPVLRYAEQLPASEALVLPMLRVKQAKYGWQESAATTWLAPWIDTDAYRAAVHTLQS